MKSLLVVVFVVFVVITVGGMIVLALIPVYIHTKDVTVYQPAPVPFLATYITSQGGTSSLLVSNTDELTTQLMQQFNLKKIKVIYAWLSASSTKKKGTNADPCETGIAATGNRFIISFTIEYPYGCNYYHCKRKFIEDVEDKIKTKYQNIMLTVKFTNGQTLDISLSLCSLIQTDSTAPSIAITATTTARSCNLLLSIGQTWSSSANLLAEYLFDNNYNDQTNTYVATPASVMAFAPAGYINQALIFDASDNEMLNVPYIPLSSTSFTIDMWLYINTLPNINDLGIFGYCSQVAQYQCLYLTIHQNGDDYHLYFGFFSADCEGVTSLPIQTWIHAAFVFDLTTFTQYIYLNGILESSCTQPSAVTAAATGITIGFIPVIDSTIGGMGYYDGYMDQMTISNRAKTACEVLEIATFVAYFTFDNGLFLTDSGPNSISATTESTSSISSGRYNQAITFGGSTASYYQIYPLTALGETNQAFSLSIWIRPTVLAGTVALISATADGYGYCLPFLGFANDGSFHAQIYDGGNVQDVGDPTTSVSLSVWSHVVQTWSSTNGLSLYINNILVASQLSTTYGGASQPLYITLGSAISGTNCATGQIVDSSYQGDMDDFRVYSRELSASDVNILYTI